MNFDREMRRASDDAYARLKARITYTTLVRRYEHPEPGDAAKLDQAMRALDIDRTQLAKDTKAAGD